MRASWRQGQGQVLELNLTVGGIYVQHRPCGDRDRRTESYERAAKVLVDRNHKGEAVAVQVLFGEGVPLYGKEQAPDPLTFRDERRRLRRRNLLIDLQVLGGVLLVLAAASSLFWSALWCS